MFCHGPLHDRHKGKASNFVSSVRPPPGPKFGPSRYREGRLGHEVWTLQGTVPLRRRVVSPAPPKVPTPEVSQGTPSVYKSEDGESR